MRHHRGRERRTHDGGHDVAAGVERVDTLPEVLGGHHREQAAQAGLAERPGHGRDRGDDHQQRRRQRAGHGEAADEQHRGHGHDVVDDDEPHPPVAVQQGTRDGAEQDARQQDGEGDHARHGRRVVLREREQHQRHRHHRLGDARELHREHHPAQVRDGEHRPIRAVEAAPSRVSVSTWERPVDGIRSGTVRSGLTADALTSLPGPAQPSRHDTATDVPPTIGGMTIDEALDRFAIVDGVSDLAAIDMFRAFVEDFGPGYLTGDAEQAYERAMMGGVARPYREHQRRARSIPALLPEFLNEYLVSTFEGEPEDAHAIAETMGRLVVVAGRRGRHRCADREGRAGCLSARRRPAAAGDGAGHAARPAGGPGRSRAWSSIRPMWSMACCASSGSSRACSGSPMASARCPSVRRPAGWRRRLVGGHHRGRQGRLLARARGRARCIPERIMPG